MVGIELDKLVWNVRDGSDPEILFIRNTSPQIFISVNFDLFFYSHQTKNVGHLQNTILLHLLWWNNCRKSKSRWTNKDLLYNTGNSAQGYVAAWIGGEFGGEWIQAYVWLSPFENIQTWLISAQIRSDQSLSRVRLFATPWIAARQASLSITNSWSSPRLMSIKSVMPSSHLNPLSSPSPPAPNPSQHQSLFQWVNSSHEVAKVLEFQL